TDATPDVTPEETTDATPVEVTDVTPDETSEETTEESTDETPEETTEESEKAAKEIEDTKAMCEAVTKSNSASFKTLRELYFTLVSDPTMRIKLVNMGDSAAARERVKAEASKFLASCTKK
ncbi:MAG: hypothetical protein CVU11_13300, partial [Bacteroidetes bacterium HGW-Bacteroidetes-6]